MIKRVLMLVVSVAALAGCAGQPSVYYTLTPSVDTRSVSASTVAPMGPYSIGSVTVPSPVDDVMIVVRRSDDQLMKLAHDRWTAPLSKQVSNALAVALTRELGMPPLPKSQASVMSGVTTISVDVQRFDLMPGQYAELAAAWQVSPAGRSDGQAVKLVCYSVLREPVEPGVVPLVKAQQANIERLAQAISAGWRNGQPGSATRCQ